VAHPHWWGILNLSANARRMRRRLKKQAQAALHNKMQEKPRQ
jgi:hypothetical protein